jgi:hypothetical protein
MRRKVKRVSLINGVAQINIGGSVKMSLDSNMDYAKRFKMQMYLDEYGVWVTHVGMKGQAHEDLIPLGVISNVMFEPEEKWEDPKKVK